MVSWVFNYVYVMTNGQGGPGDATQVTELYIYQTAFQYQSPELAAAAAVTLFARHARLHRRRSSASSAARGSVSMSRRARRDGLASTALLIAGDADRALPRLRDDHGGVQDAVELPRASVGADRRPDARRLPHGAQRPVPALARQHACSSRSRRSRVTLARRGARRLGLRALVVPRPRRRARRARRADGGAARRPARAAVRVRRRARARSRRSGS